MDENASLPDNMCAMLKRILLIVNYDASAEAKIKFLLEGEEHISALIAKHETPVIFQYLLRQDYIPRL